MGGEDAIDPYISLTCWDLVATTRLKPNRLPVKSNLRRWANRELEVLSCSLNCGQCITMHDEAAGRVRFRLCEHVGKKQRSLATFWNNIWGNAESTVDSNHLRRSASWLHLPCTYVGSGQKPFWNSDTETEELLNESQVQARPLPSIEMEAQSCCYHNQNHGGCWPVCTQKTWGAPTNETETTGQTASEHFNQNINARAIPRNFKPVADILSGDCFGRGSGSAGDSGTVAGSRSLGVNWNDMIIAF